MPPAVRRASLDDARAAFFNQSDVVIAWASAVENLDDPSRIAGWTVRDVLAHLALSARRLTQAIGEPTRVTPLELSGYVAGYAEAAESIAEQPSTLPGDPREALSEATSQVEQALTADKPATVVMPGGPLRLADALVTRTIELVVHGDDVGIGPDRGALGLVVRGLTGVLATRQPGRAVELRVPPYSAVQVLEGTVHRRGTPTAVVSCEPMTWVRLATGRLTWPQALDTGTLTASGERSDLSAYLPLLR